MNKSQLIALYDQDQRRDVEYPDTRREVQKFGFEMIAYSYPCKWKRTDQD